MGQAFQPARQTGMSRSSLRQTVLACQADRNVARGAGFPACQADRNVRLTGRALRVLALPKSRPKHHNANVLTILPSMTNPHPPVPRVAVIGGGISGLAAAHRLCELSPTLRITLYESRDRLGGVLQTVRRDGYLIEWGADNFITNVPWGVELCRRIGYADQLAQTNSEHRHAFVVRRGRLHKIPEGFIIMAPSRVWPVVTTPILSPWGKLRMAWEYFVPKSTQADIDESLAAFVVRRFGRETYERLVQPLVGGIYTGNPEKLSLQSTMPRFQEMERQHGSLIRAVWRQVGQRRSESQHSSGARYSMFMAPQAGMSHLIETLAARLPAGAVQLDSPVACLTPGSSGGWDVTIGGNHPATEHFDAVVLATSATASGELTASLGRRTGGRVSRDPACQLLDRLDRLRPRPDPSPVGRLRFCRAAGGKPPDPVGQFLQREVRRAGTGRFHVAAGVHRRRMPAGTGAPAGRRLDPHRHGGIG